MLSAIENRRSIRKYGRAEVPGALLKEIVRAGTLAPSSKNRQPWKFIVVTGGAKAELTAVMARGLEREQKNSLLPGSREYLSGAEHTMRIMEQAPAVICVVNPLGREPEAELTPEERIYELCNAQSVGAAMENMTLTATELGLGSLWICDTYFAFRELTDWLDAGGPLMGALAVGAAEEAPPARPRKPLRETVVWRD